MGCTIREEKRVDPESRSWFPSKSISLLALPLPKGKGPQIDRPALSYTFGFKYGIGRVERSRPTLTSTFVLAIGVCPTADPGAPTGTSSQELRD